MQVYNNFGYLNDDVGYTVMKQNQRIDFLIPYTRYTEPRLVRFLRTAYYFIELGTEPCTPLKDQFWIKDDDCPQLERYIKNHKLKIDLKKLV